MRRRVPQSDGASRCRATDYYNRLASRIGAALGTPTAAGPLYDVDTRLRPQGAQGMLAVSLAAFEAYQRSEAWTWEHMALCRARPLTGSAGAAGQGRRPDLSTSSAARATPPSVRADAAAMRDEMARHKPPAGPLDIKLGPGGLVDLEFAVHTLQLTHRIGLDPRLEVALAALVEAGLIDDGADPDLRLLSRDAGRASAGRARGDGAGRAVAGAGRDAVRPCRLAIAACGDRRGAAEDRGPLGAKVKE